jgi:hypothetical protein
MARSVIKVNAEFQAAEKGCRVIALPRGMSRAQLIFFGVEKVEAFRSLSELLYSEYSNLREVYETRRM